VAMIRGVVFDLDDTLYFERYYVRSGLQFVANTVAQDAKLPAESLFSFLWQSFLDGVRGNTFDALLAEFPAAASRFSVDTLVRLYREHPPSITLTTEPASLLTKLYAAGYRLGLISDGPYPSQSAKVEALGLRNLLDPVILTDQWGKGYWKPHPRAFETVAGYWGLVPSELVYVGDNPQKDFAAPKRLGWHTVRLRCLEQLRWELEPTSQDDAPNIQIDSLTKLSDYLQLRS